MDWRAETLGRTTEEAKAREHALPGVDGPPPYDRLDHNMAEEAARIWVGACASCHGVDGKPPETVTPPPDLGQDGSWKGLLLWWGQNEGREI